jgi:LacI family transcriptional regulator
MSGDVTLSDIADHLGVTKVTVSKSLRDHSDISDSTKERVRETAQEMGYQHNRLAQSLTLGRTLTIGVIIPKISHTFFSQVLGGINKIAAESEYEIILCVSDEQEEQERAYLQTLLSMQVDGLLVSVSEETSDTRPFQEVTDQNIPLVFFDRGLEDVDASSVVVDDWGGAYEAITHAIENGNERIAHIAGYSHVQIGRQRRLGYEDALRDHGRPVRDELLVEGGFGEKNGYAAAKTLLESGTVPDAIFAVTFPVALGVEDRIREVDPSIRKDIQFYSFGQHNLNRFFRHPHISVYQPARRLGEKATSLLLHEIEHPSASTTEIELSTRIVTPEEPYALPYLQESKA